MSESDALAAPSRPPPRLPLTVLLPRPRRSYLASFQPESRPPLCFSKALAAWASPFAAASAFLDSVIALGVGLILCTEHIGDDAAALLAQRGVEAVQLVPEDEVIRD